ncbi:glucose dehydrogenase [Plakobranchus ocellatus]|uniref:Glucose dehydrogenase n=1 Tax=Plakobranchus ocellatus TaxID=259542 RepID=A0AAV4CBG1_9GAST|nr:glucose dehydrogenase [Plakobranchus ocellatus]
MVNLIVVKPTIFAALTALAIDLLHTNFFQREPRVATTINATYDFIVVGGGAAGSTLAARLSENQDATVLLLEAGPSDWGNPKFEIPALGMLAYDTDLDWAYTTERQDGLFKGMEDERSRWPRGKVLGGSGSINAMMVARGSRHDYDRWADYTGDQTWNYRHVLSYFKKMEDMQVEGLRDSAYHGKDGPLTINWMNSGPLSEKLIEAGHDLGFSNNDYNGKSMEGYFHVQNNVANQKRLSSSKAYLHPAMERPNLDVAVNSHVQKVVIVNKRAVGVEVIRNGRKLTVSARKEVILSAGAIGSPHILMLSGVGPRKHLEDLHIPVAADLPVGENLQDHVMVDIAVMINESYSYRMDDFTSPWALMQYYLFGSGALHVPNALEVGSFHKVTPESKEKDWPDLQLNFMNLASNTDVLRQARVKKELIEEMKHRDEYEFGFSCLPHLLRPESRGRITLASRDPFDYPLIKANYLDSQYDIDILFKGVEVCKKLIKTKTMQSIGAKIADTKPFSSCKHHEFDSRDYWECLWRHVVLTAYHPVGTCKMGPEGDPTAVVDSQFRVQGISGLRVADASIMPWVISGNTHIPTIMIAEKAADTIPGKQPLPPQDFL